jgi:hypothetical protein
MQNPRNGKLKNKAQKRVDRNTPILRHMPIPRPHGLAQMRKNYEERQKNDKWKHSTGQLTPQERALAITWVPPTFEFNKQWELIMSMRGSGASLPTYLKEFDYMCEGWTPDPQVCTTHKLSSNSSGDDSESNATGESAKTSAFNAADGMKPPRPAMATSKPTDPGARAKRSASKPPAAKTSASKPLGPSLPLEVQAGATDTPAKTAEPARVVQTVHSGAPVDARICDRELPRTRVRRQFKLSDYVF